MLTSQAKRQHPRRATSATHFENREPAAQVNHSEHLGLQWHLGAETKRVHSLKSVAPEDTNISASPWFPAPPTPPSGFMPAFVDT